MIEISTLFILTYQHLWAETNWSGLSLFVENKNFDFDRQRRKTFLSLSYPFPKGTPSQKRLLSL